MGTPRLRRLTTVAVVSVLALASLSGCGKAVTDTATSAGAPAVQTNPDTAATAGAAVPGTAQVPAGGTLANAGDSGTTSGGAAAPGSNTAAKATGTEGKTTGVDKTTNKQADTTGNKPASNKTGTTPTTGNTGTTTDAATLAVQKLVASHPMFGGKGVCKPASLSEIPIGNVSTLSGVLGELFSPVVPALNVFVASVNACGGLNGHRVKLYFEDDQGDPSTASTKVQSLIQNKKVLAFVGNIEVLTVDAIVPVINRYKIPVIGSDLTNNTWFTNPLMFPQGASQQAISYGFVNGAMSYHKNPNIGVLWCIEVPRACEQSNRAIGELAPKVGATVKKSIQVSITAPSYVEQCLEMKNAGVEVVALPVDAATMNRFARSCQQVGFDPKVMPHPLGAGNEKQLLSGNKWLGNGYVPLTVFPWMGDSTPAEKYYQAAVKKYDPGFTTGGAASLGWSAGALLLAAAADLSPDHPTTQQLLDALWTFKGQKFTELGGLTGPRTFGQGVNPKVPYCLFAAVSNDANTGWKTVVSKPTCTNLIAPSDPQAAG